MNETKESQCEECLKFFYKIDLYLGVCAKCAKKYREHDKAELQGKDLCELPYIYEENEGHYFDY